MPRVAVLVSSIVLLFGIGLAAWLLTERAAPAPRVSDTVARVPDASLAATASPASDAATTSPAPTERSLADSAETGPPEPPQDDTTRRLHGTVTVVDADEREHTRCSGQIELLLLVPMGDDSHRVDTTKVEVRDGAFEARAGRDVTLVHVGPMRLDERFAFCEDTFELGAEEVPITLRARWLQALRLRVVGQDTHTDLGNLRVVQSPTWDGGLFRHPGDLETKVIVANGRSPLSLQPTEHQDSERYWVTAPGYAWDAIEMATDDPGERVLQLTPGGGVDLAILGVLPEGDAVLRVRPLLEAGPAGGPTVATPPDSTPITEFRAKGNDVLRIEALPVGAWSLSVEKGRWFGDRLVLGHTEVNVTARSIATASITLRADAPRPPLLSVQGTLTLSPRWGKEITLELDPAGPLEAWTDDRVHMELDGMDEVGGNTYRWGPRPLLAGRWQVLVSGTEYRTSVEIGPGLPTDLRIEVPEPNDVRVRVVDAISGELIPGAEPSWFSIPEGWTGGWGHAHMEPVDDGWYHTLAPTGTIKINVHPPDYLWYHQEHEVRRGDNEFVVRVGRVCGVEIVLRCDGVTVPHPETSFARITHTTTQASAAYWSGCKIAASEPGEHRLTFDELPGFEPIEPRTVVIEPAQWTRVEIDLHIRK